ncbi:MAG: phenylalanine--tRNA ligase subunit beta [Firmicutes bacterium]|nr:phenylalanine--tRNA ligase subunit beta [Bacillota bacterium]
MKVPYNWLRDYVEIELLPEELAERLTMAGLETGAVNVFAPLGEKFVAGRIESLRQHPYASNLQLVKVDIGNEFLEVVCGAKNIKKGDMVPVALTGAVLPGGAVIREAEIKGIVSPGMLCSGEELGVEIAEDEAGIMLLDIKCSPGDRIIDLLPFNEPVLEIDLTPNRGDCLGMLGIAREVAAITGKKIVLPPNEVQEEGKEIDELAAVEIKDPDLCFRYTARIMEGFSIKPSPLKMQFRLLAAGIRSINNLVDVTNYVMWETGFPMHAFDYDKLAGGKIIVRRAKQGEELVTLDGVKRILDPNVLVIADTREPVGLAGVMGGENTEITAETNRLLLEVASFKPVNIRMTARKMNLPSEASQRYEKGVDPEGAIFVQNRAVRLINEIAGGKILRGIIDKYPYPMQKREITLRKSKVQEILGYSLPEDRIKEILTGLSLVVKKKDILEHDVSFHVEIPSFRNDLHIEVDLIEELARINGYDKIPITLPAGVLTSGRRSFEQRVISKIKETLLSCGLQEVITFSFINPKLFDLLQLPSDDIRRNTVKLQNPLTEDQSVLRTTLIPELLKLLQYNFNHQTQNQFIFEIGKVFFPSEKNKLPLEKKFLALVLSGKKPLGDWQNPPKPLSFYEIKGILETLMQSLGIKETRWEEASLPLLHPARGCKILVQGKEIGFAGCLHPFLQEKLDFKQEVFLAELMLEPLLEACTLIPKFRSLPRFPSVLRDAAFIVSRKVKAEDLLQTIRTHGGELLEEVVLFDVYEGKQIPEDCLSIAFAMTFRHPDKTLTDEEIDQILEKVAIALQEKFNATLRKS